jgi:hypothetical protein
MHPPTPIQNIFFFGKRLVLTTKFEKDMIFDKEKHTLYIVFQNRLVQIKDENNA